jgi:hypothetical protein
VPESFSALGTRQDIVRFSGAALKAGEDRWDFVDATNELASSLGGRAAGTLNRLVEQCREQRLALTQFTDGLWR